MRDIKFRIRNTVNGGVDYVTIEHLLTSDQSGMSSKAVNDDFQISQFTGLKDKNGVEIYEGDILLYSNRANHHTDFSNKYVVEFGEQDLGDSTYQQTVGWNATEAYNYGKESLMDSGRLSNGILSIFGCHNIEIIGNIHENPELLQETK